MLKNYLKLAIKVLGRRKFYTFVSLFGISFTLMVLMVIMSFLDNLLGANKPMTELDRMVFVDRLEMKTMYYDTIYTIDSSMVGGEMTYDTTGFDTQDAGRSQSSGSVGFKVFDQYLTEEEIDNLETYTYMFDRPFDVFTDGRKYQMDGLYTTASYWDVFDFDFLEGRPYNISEEEGAASVMVISDRIAREYFGTDKDIVGRTIPLSGRQFEIVGLVAHTRQAGNSFTQSEVYLPVTTADAQVIGNENMGGPFRAAYLAPSADQRDALQDALDFAGKELPIPPDVDFEDIRIYAFNGTEKVAHSIFYDDDISKSLFQFKLVVFGLLGFFILIPVLNLINLNLSRMIERSSEIGVRKSFGADSRHILFQFLFENVIITFIGGAIGMILAFAVIQFINQSEVLPDATLGFNWRVFLYSFLVCLLFGLLSGLLPAWRMSRLHIVKGLNA